MSISLESLQKSITQLEQAEKDFKQFPENQTIRAGAVKCFEYSYEISRKLLHRFLERKDDMRYSLGEELFRIAWDRGYLKSDYLQWKEYRKLRNLTAHEYGLTKAQEVIDGIPDFLSEVRFLEKQIREDGKAE